MKTWMLRSTLLLGVLLAPAHADTPAPGYSVQSSPSPAFAAPMTTLPGGDFVTFDGQNVDRWTPQGGFVQTLGHFATSVFPSFVVVEPSGASVVLGESSTNMLWRAATDGSGMTALAQLPWNYAAAFSPSGGFFVSAALGPVGPNGIFEVTIPGGTVTQLAQLAGPSGPITFDASGALFYATQFAGFPAPAGSTDVLRWSAAQVAAGGLSEVGATLVCQALDGGASLAVDPLTQRLYIAETNFGLGTNRIRRVGSTQANSPIVIEGTASIFGLQFLPGATAASFDAYQPDTGVRLAYGSTDFFSISERAIASPKRPQLVLSGPGLNGPGPVTLTLTGGVPDGTAYLLYCKQSLLLPSELPLPFHGFVLHTSFFLPRTRRLPFLLPADANGTTVLQIHNPGNLQGLNAYQFLVGGPTGVFVGSSSIAQF